MWGRQGPGAIRIWNSETVIAVEGALMTFCNDVSTRASTEPAVEPLRKVRKSETIVTAKSQHATRAMLIFDEQRILALDGRQRVEVPHRDE